MCYNTVRTGGGCLSLRLRSALSAREASMLNGLQLAYLGDAVWETVIRTEMVQRGLNVHHMHNACVGFANAHDQARFLQSIHSLLNADEMEIVRRGRNAHARHPAPKNQNPEDYSASTGFEALIGYLYITGNDSRIAQLAEMIIGGSTDG